jgi:putative acyl-CoA dehydrogenase
MPATRRCAARSNAAGRKWRDAEPVRQGAEYGAEPTPRAAEDANHFEPELHTFRPRANASTR